MAAPYPRNNTDWTSRDWKICKLNTYFLLGSSLLDFAVCLEFWRSSLFIRLLRLLSTKFSRNRNALQEPEYISCIVLTITRDVLKETTASSPSFADHRLFCNINYKPSTSAMSISSNNGSPPLAVSNPLRRRLL